MCNDTFKEVIRLSAQGADRTLNDDVGRSHTGQDLELSVLGSGPYPKNNKKVSFWKHLERRGTI